MDDNEKSDANDGEETTTYRSPFGVEVDMRESHLAALLGKPYHEWFESLNRASKVFSDNTLELMNHLTNFVGTMVHVNELPDGFDVEANRLLPPRTDPASGPATICYSSRAARVFVFVVFGFRFLFWVRFFVVDPLQRTGQRKRQPLTARLQTPVQRSYSAVTRPLATAARSAS